MWENNNWRALTDNSTGVSGTNNEIRSIAFDDNNLLYVGGNFDTAGGNPASRIASWNGSSWSGLGSGTSGFVQAIEPVGDFIYAGGNFSIAGNKTVNRIARFNQNNQSWETLGNGLSGNVNTIVSHNSFIYAGGSFKTASDDGNVKKTVNNLARWSSTLGLEALGPNTYVGVNTLVNTIDFKKNSTELIVGGNFNTAGNLNTDNIAIWAETFCDENAIIPEYKINGVWDSGSNTLTINSGDTLVLSISPNDIKFTVTLRDGESFPNDYNLGAVKLSMAGSYIFTTAQECTKSFELIINGIQDEDTDNDGVKNNLDICPNTTAGETVDEDGCSNTQLNSDSDNDGVVDTEDSCPNTPVGESVDANGCSTSQLDTDGDGVVDKDDECPDTTLGEIVNSNGCASASFPDGQFSITTKPNS